MTHDTQCEYAYRGGGDGVRYDDEPPCRCEVRAMTISRDAYQDLVKENEGLKEELDQLEKLALERADQLAAMSRDIIVCQGRLVAQANALREVRRLLRLHWSDNPTWRNGHEHTWTGQADLIAEAALAAPKEPKG